MQLVSLSILLLFLISCNQPFSTKETAIEPVVIDSPANFTDTFPSTPQAKSIDTIKAASRRNKVTIVPEKIDSVLLLKLSAEILTAIKKRDYKAFASFIHPHSGIRFSPYANISVTRDKLFKGQNFLDAVTQNKKLIWNSAWDIDAKEYLTVEQYFKKHVYDVDFINAKIISVNEFRSQGTDLNNIRQVYPGCNVVEFFFPGFEKKYEGMDFRGLRLVFKSLNSKLFLIGIVHDQWTP